MRDSIKPVVQAQRTNVQVNDQGYTYNEPGISYDEIGVEYGGVYGEDVIPMISFAKLSKPIIASGIDFSSS